jgi:predicted nucleic acid-binding protein
MANRILQDINICLDFILKREPFSDSAGRIFQAVEHEKVKALISAIFICFGHH